MTISTEDIHKAFSQFDDDKDGFIDEQQFLNALEELKLINPNNSAKITTLVNKFLHKTPLNNKNKATTKEFEYFAKYIVSPFNSIPEILIKGSRLIAQFNHLWQNKNFIYSPDHFIACKVIDETANKPQPNEIHLIAGVEDSKEKFGKVLGQDVPSKCAIVLEVTTETKDGLVDTLNENLNVLKEILPEISNELKVLLNTVTLTANETPTGVQIVLNLEPNELVQLILEFLKTGLEHLKNEPNLLSFFFSFALDLNDLDTNLKNIHQEQFFAEMDLTNVSINKLMKDENMKSGILSILDTQPPLHQLKKLFTDDNLIEFEIKVTQEIKNTFPKSSGSAGEVESINKMIEQTVKEMENNGIYDFIETFSCVTEIIKALKKANATSGALILKIGEFHVGFKIKVPIWTILSKILKIEE